jgi:NADPH2:quinone reductase
VKAIVLRELGAPEALVPEEVEEPELEPGRVLVDVRASGINFADVLVRSGAYLQPPPLPLVPGDEVSGDVVAVADDVTSVQVGDRVMGITLGAGGYAERAAVEASLTFPLPQAATYEQGASFLSTFLTAYIPLTRQAHVVADQTALVHAAAGGVGSAALQLLQHLGVRTIATAGSDEKLKLAQELGAFAGVNYRSPQWASQVRELTEGKGVDVVLDTVGGDVFGESLRLVAPLGTLVAIGFAGGQWPDVNPSLIAGRNASLAGFFLGRLYRFARPEIQACVVELTEIWRAGSIAPIVGRTFPLEEAAHAHRFIEERRSMGKVVLVP